MMIPTPHIPAKDYAQALAKAKGIRLMIFDIDGVMTSGALYYTEAGETMKVFHVHDGHGLKKLQNAGIQTAVISGRQSPALTKRLTDLGINHIYTGYSQDKIPAFENLLQVAGVAVAQCGMMGDDEPDLPIMERCGFTIAPPLAFHSVRAKVDWITHIEAGKGAVREACELILSAKNS